MNFIDWLEPLPLVAILRGIKPTEAVEIASVLSEAEFRIIEVPLNSPDPLTSIAKLAEHFDGRVLVGAGTVLDAQSVADVAAAGGQVIVMPHADADLVKAAKSQNLFALPGFATPTEAFHMLHAGADALKLFPAEATSPQVLKAMRAVLPAGTAVLPVGGITPEKMKAYLDAGATGFGLGSALYASGMRSGQVAERAKRFVAEYRAVRRSRR